ncbi:MAG: hypothetical protein ABI600_17650 [Luteolibacter sp.]
MESDGVFGAFGVDGSGIRKTRQQTSRSDHLSLDFGDFSPPGFETLRSFGVWAKNSARDITWEDA